MILLGELHLVHLQELRPIQLRILLAVELEASEISASTGEVQELGMVQLQIVQLQIVPVAELVAFEMPTLKEQAQRDHLCLPQ